MCENSTERTVWALSSAMTSWKRAIALVRHAAAVLEARDDVVLDGGEARDPLRLDGEVVGGGRAREPGGVLGRQRVAARLGVDLDDASGRHRAEPLADVALVEPGRVGELLARRVVERGKRVEEARTVTDGDHHHERAAVQQVEHAPGERLGAAQCRTSLGPLPPSGRDSSLPSVLTCARCGQENPDGAKFCNACGAPLDEPGRHAARSGGSSRCSSSTSSGFTARSEKLDPEDVRAILTPYYERVRAELEGFGGTVEKFIGDAVMGVFGAPRPTATTPSGPCARRSPSATGPRQDGLQVRIAVNTGEAIVDLEARTRAGQAMIAGDVVNTASRLQSAAPVGAVLVGEETYAATRGAIEYRPAQPLRRRARRSRCVRGSALHASAAVRRAAATPVPMIGRERELGVLTGAWERVADEGRRQFVTVFGPAGHRQVAARARALAARRGRARV